MTDPAGPLSGSVALRPVLRYRDLVLLYVVLIFGIRQMVMAAAIGPSVVMYLLIAFAVFTLPLVIAVAELSSRHPGEGGLYVWTKRAFGDFHAFAMAWAYWTSILAFFPSALYFAAGNAAYIFPNLSFLGENRFFLAGFGLAALAGVLYLNIRGLDIAQKLHNLGAVFTLGLPVLILLSLGLATWVLRGPASPFTWESMSPDLGSLKSLVFLSVVAYAFAGFEGASLLGDEVHDARRTIPRALVSSGLLITLGYILSAIAILAMLTPEAVNSLTGLPEALRAGGTDLAGPYAGALAGSLIGLFLCVGTIGSVSAWLAATSRLPFVLGLDRHLPAAFTRLHPRFGTPHIGMAVLAGIAAFFIVLAGLGERAEQVYHMMVSLEIVIYFVPYLYLFGALVVLQREPAGPTVQRAPGGRTGAVLLGGVGFAVTLGALILALIPGEDVENPVTFFMTVFGSLGLNVAVGLWIYRRGRRR